MGSQFGNLTTKYICVENIESHDNSNLTLCSESGIKFTTSKFLIKNKPIDEYINELIFDILPSTYIPYYKPVVATVSKENITNLGTFENDIVDAAYISSRNSYIRLDDDYAKEHHINIKSNSILNIETPTFDDTTREIVDYIDNIFFNDTILKTYIHNVVNSNNTLSAIPTYSNTPYQEHIDPYHTTNNSEFFYVLGEFFTKTIKTSRVTTEYIKDYQAQQPYLTIESGSTINLDANIIQINGTNLDEIIKQALDENNLIDVNIKITDNVRKLEFEFDKTALGQGFRVETYLFTFTYTLKFHAIPVNESTHEILVSVVNSMFVFDPVLDNLIKGDIYVFNNTNQKDTHPLAFHFNQNRYEPFLYLQQDNGYLTIENFENFTSLYAHCENHDNMGENVNGPNGLLIFPETIEVSHIQHNTTPSIRYTINNVNSSTSYDIYVVVTNDKTNISLPINTIKSNELILDTQLVNPSSVYGLSVTVIGSTTIKIEWEHFGDNGSLNNPPDWIRLYYNNTPVSIENHEDYIVIDPDAINNMTSLSNSELDGDILTYSFMMIKFYSNQFGYINSNRVYGSFTPPTGATNLTFEYEISSIIVSWDSLGNDGDPSDVPTSIRLYYKSPSLSREEITDITDYVTISSGSTSVNVETDMTKSSYGFIITKSYDVYGDISSDSYNSIIPTQTLPTGASEFKVERITPTRFYVTYYNDGEHGSPVDSLYQVNLYYNKSDNVVSKTINEGISLSIVKGTSVTIDVSYANTDYTFLICKEYSYYGPIDSEVFYSNHLEVSPMVSLLLGQSIKNINNGSYVNGDLKWRNQTWDKGSTVAYFVANGFIVGEKTTIDATYKYLTTGNGKSSFGRFNIGNEDFTIAFVVSTKGLSPGRLTYGIMPDNEININVNSTEINFFRLQRISSGAELDEEPYIDSEYFFLMFSYSNSDDGTLIKYLFKPDGASYEIPSQYQTGKNNVRTKDVHDEDDTFNSGNTTDRIFTLVTDSDHDAINILDMIIMPGVFMRIDDTDSNFQMILSYVSRVYGFAPS
jgi:hypothetical protein